MSLLRFVKTKSALSAVITVCLSFGYIGAAEIGCSRDGLTAAVNTYLAAMEAGDHTLMPLTSNARYVENDRTTPQSFGSSIAVRVIPFGEGLWTIPHKVDHRLNLIDVDSCAAFTEVVITNTCNPYILGVRLKVTGNQISDVFAVVTTTGDWLFNAANFARYSRDENWGVLPVDQRLTRQQLLADAEAYFRYFNTANRPMDVPWHGQCARLEGGAYTGDRVGACQAGIPDLNMNINTLWHLADVDHGMVVLYVYFGGPDTHLFRILPTGYRYIHTLTAMRQCSFNNTCTDDGAITINTNCGDQASILPQNRQRPAQLVKTLGSSIHLNMKGRGKVDIYGLNGVKIRTAEVGQGSHTLRMNDLPTGTYLVRASSGGLKQSVKMVVR